MPLSQFTVEKIGSLIGFPYTYFDEQGGPPEGASDGEVMMSGEAHVVEAANGKPPLLIFTGLVPGHQYQGNNNSRSILVLNLRTMRPTRNSFRKTSIPEHLVSALRHEYYDLG